MYCSYEFKMFIVLKYIKLLKKWVNKSKMNIKLIYMYILLCLRVLVIFVLFCLYVKCIFNFKLYYNICLDM